VAGLVVPDDLAGAGVDREETAAVRRDEELAVGDDGRELDQAVGLALPDLREGRPLVEGAREASALLVVPVGRPRGLAQLDLGARRGARLLRRVELRRCGAANGSRVAPLVDDVGRGSETGSEEEHQTDCREDPALPGHFRRLCSTA
jgi:hypothetical protein